MSRTRRFSLLSLLAIVLGTLLLASACGNETGWAAITVNDEQISINEFSEELDAYAEDDNVVLLEGVTTQLESQGLPTEPANEQTLSSSVAASIATRRIAYTLMEQELDERGIEVTDEDVDAMREELSANVDPTTGEPVEGESPFSGLTAVAQRQVARDQAIGAALSEELAVPPEEVTDEAVAAALESGGEESCASIILTATEAEAAAALARVQRGEDFATIATEVSQDQSAAEGGDIGCVTEGQTLPELDTALAGLEPGAVAGPVAFTSTAADGTAQEAFFVVRLESRGPRAEEDVRAELQAQADQVAQQTDPLSEFIIGALADADVRVASRYGSWEPEGITLPSGQPSGPTVVPPEGPEGETTATTAPGAGGVTIDPTTGLPVQEAPVPEGG